MDLRLFCSHHHPCHGRLLWDMLFRSCHLHFCCYVLSGKYEYCQGDVREMSGNFEEACCYEPWTYMCPSKSVLWIQCDSWPGKTKDGQGKVREFYEGQLLDTLIDSCIWYWDSLAHRIHITGPLWGNPPVMRLFDTDTVLSLAWTSCWTMTQGAGDFRRCGAPVISL